MFVILLMSDAASIGMSILTLILGAILGVVATRVDQSIKNRQIVKKNEESRSQLPVYDPLKDDIIVLRRWNSIDTLSEVNTRIKYDESKIFDSQNPIITCPFISNQEEWIKMYSEAIKKEKKRSGAISYVTKLSLDHKDNRQGNRLELEVSTCDYLAHDINSKYMRNHPEDWEKIKTTLVNGELDDYFDHAMPGNLFVNFIVINGETNNVLAIKRSKQELNARNIWGLTGFETMNDVANASNGSEELKLKGIVFRGLEEELTLQKEEVAQVAISAISFVKHLGLMVTALVRINLVGDQVQDSEQKKIIPLTEGEFIHRILSKSESVYEHSNLKWIPINMEEMKKYIESGSGYYKDILVNDGNEDSWISYTKLQMYEIWRNHESINIVL